MTVLAEEGRMAQGKYRAIFEAASAGGENDEDMYLQEPGVEGVFVLFGGSSLDASVLSTCAAYEKGTRRSL